MKESAAEKVHSRHQNKQSIVNVTTAATTATCVLNKLTSCVEQWLMKLITEQCEALHIANSNSVQANEWCARGKRWLLLKDLDVVVSKISSRANTAHTQQRRHMHQRGSLQEPLSFNQKSNTCLMQLTGASCSGTLRSTLLAIAWKKNLEKMQHAGTKTYSKIEK